MLQKGTEKSKRTLGLVFSCVLMLSFSFSSSLYYTLQPYVIKHYGLTLTQSSWISIAGSIGNMAINLIVMVIGDKFDKSKLLRVLTFLLAAALVVMGFAPALGLFMVIYALNGMIGYWMDMLTTSYVSDLYGDERSRYIGILYTLYTVGSAIAPTFNTLVLETLGLGWEKSYLFAGIYTLVVAICFTILIVVVGEPHNAAVATVDESGEKKDKLSVKEALSNRNMVALILASVSTGFAGYFSSILPVYFDTTNPTVYTTAIAGVIVTCASVGGMISRFAYVPLADKINPVKYLRFQALFCAACNAICLIVNKPIVWMVVMFLWGLINSSSHTMMVVLTCGEYPDRSAAATATTALFTGVAYMFVTPVMNFVAEKLDFTVAMIIPILFNVCTFLIHRFIYVEHKAPVAAAEQE